MGKGKRYELRLVKDLDAATDDDVWVVRPDYSGNSVTAVSDVAMVWPADRGTHGAFLEVKKRSPGTGLRASGAVAGSSQGQSGIEEVEELIEQAPPWVEPYVVIKFPNREPLVYGAEALREFVVEKNPSEPWEPYSAGVPKLTPSENISVKKPTTDEWPSTQAGRSDVETILDEIHHV